MDWLLPSQERIEKALARGNPKDERFVSTTWPRADWRPVTVS